MGSFILHRRSLIACIAILAVTVTIGGCFGGGGGVAPPTGAVIKGYVTEINTENPLRFEAGLLSSGPGVSGATVTLGETRSHVATTDSLGGFTFTNVTPGTYNVTVTKSGWASAAAYDVHVASNRTNEVMMKMMKPGGDVPVAAGTPPTVLVNCQSPVRDLEHIEVTTSSNFSRINGILLFIDNLYVSSSQPDTSHAATSWSLTYPWDTLSGQSVADNGEHTITAMAMDEYGNIGHKSIVVTVDNIGQPIAPPKTPTNVKACAATVHYSVFDLLNEFDETYQREVSSSLADRVLGLIKSAKETTSLIRPLAMPTESEAVTYCRVTWQTEDDLAGLSGFKVYRDEVFIGESPASQSESATALVIQPSPVRPQAGSYIDGSSKLIPNVPVSYRVSAYNRWGEGNKSNSTSTTPLNKLDKVTGLTVEKPVTSAIALPADYWLFEWDDVPGARLYAIRIIRGLDGTVVREDYTTANQVSVDLSDLGSEYDEDYHCYVLALNSRQDLPPSFSYETWQPADISVSASDFLTFTVPGYQQ